MAVFQIKKYKIIKDENGNKVKKMKSKEEYNRETCGGTKTWYFKVYYKDIFGNSKQKKSRLFELKREAEIEERLFLDNMVNSHHTKFEIVANAYFKDYKSRMKDSSYDTYVDVYKNHIKVFFEGFYIEDIDIKVIKKWKEEMRKKTYQNKGKNIKYSTNFLNKIYNVLSNILNYGMIYYNLNVNSAQLIGPFEEKKNKVVKDEEKLRYITLDDFNIFVSFIDNLMWKTFFIFLMFTGLRKGEARALTWKNVDFVNNEIKVVQTMDEKNRITNTKNGKNRRVKMNKYLIEQMEIYKSEVMKHSDFTEEWFVFGGINSLPRVEIDRKKDFYFKIANENSNHKIQRITLHEFRHSHVSLLINEYVRKCEKLNLKIDATKFFIALSNRMGHTIQVMEHTYMHLFPTIQDEIVELLDNL